MASFHSVLDFRFASHYQYRRFAAVRTTLPHSSEFGKSPIGESLYQFVLPSMRFSVLTAAHKRRVNISDTLIFLREYPAENVAMDGKLQSENPKILEALKKINVGA